MEPGEPWSSVIDAVLERGHLETDTWGEGHVKMGADMGGSGSKPANTKDSQEPTEAERGAQDRSLLRASEATGPAHTSSSDSGLRTVSARMSTALSSQSVVLHSSCPRTPVALPSSNCPAPDPHSAAPLQPHPVWNCLSGSDTLAHQVKRQLSGPRSAFEKLG